MNQRYFARAIRIVLLLVVAYALWTTVIPWLKAHGSFDRVSLPTRMERSAASPSEGEAQEGVAACLSAARRANRRVTGRLRALRDPAQAAARWQSMSESLHEEVESATDSCSCASPACQRASEAMATLSDLVGQFDSTFDGRAESLPDPGEAEAEVQRLLGEARKLALQSPG